jgi:hypothetical protein
MMKLFIWKNVLCDYTSGVVFALAKDVEQARQIVLKNLDELPLTGTVKQAMSEEPEVHEEPYGFALWGGA